MGGPGRNPMVINYKSPELCFVIVHSTIINQKGEQRGVNTASIHQAGFERSLDRPVFRTWSAVVKVEMEPGAVVAEAFSFSMRTI